MPRKPKPPMPFVRIEGLSGVKNLVEITATFVDELDGSVHELKPDALAQVVMNDPKVIVDYRKRMRIQRMVDKYLEAKQFTDQRDRAHKLLFAKREQTLAHNQHKLSDELVLTIHRPIPPWRRL